MKNPTESKYLFLLFFLAILVLVLYMVKPFLPTLLVAAIISYAVYPIYKKILNRIKSKGMSAAIVLLILILVLSAPFLLIVGALSKETYDAYVIMKESVIGDQLEVECEDEGVCQSIENNDQEKVSNGIVEKAKSKLNEDMESYVQSAAATAVGWIFAKISSFIVSVPNILLKVFLGLFAMFYMLIDGEQMVKSLRKSLPLSDKDSTKIFQHFNDVIYATIYGAIVIAFIQGIIAGIGYFIFGVTSPIILGALTIIAAFIPFVGAAIIWAPVSIAMIANGLIIGDNTGALKGAGLFLYGVLVISTIDNFIRPKLVGDRAKIHPLVIILGVFGGITIFGFAGIMVGPLLLTLFFAALKIYDQHRG